MDFHTGKSRGFGFVSFESEAAVDAAMSFGRVHEVMGKQVRLSLDQWMLELQLLSERFIGSRRDAATSCVYGEASTGVTYPSAVGILSTFAWNRQSTVDGDIFQGRVLEVMSKQVCVPTTIGIWNFNAFPEILQGSHRGIAGRP